MASGTSAPIGDASGWPTRRRSSTTRGTFTGANAVDADTWLVTNRLEGDFPGGVVDLDYRFRLAGDAIVELLIAP